MQADLSATQNKIFHQYTEVLRTQEAQQEAESAYEMYLSRYKNGLMDLSTLLQIQQLLEQAEKKHIESAYGYWTLLAIEAADRKSTRLNSSHVAISYAVFCCKIKENYDNYTN